MKEAADAEVALSRSSAAASSTTTKRYYLRGRPRRHLRRRVETAASPKNRDPRSLEAFVRWGVENYPVGATFVMWGPATGGRRDVATREPRAPPDGRVDSCRAHRASGPRGRGGRQPRAATDQPRGRPRLRHRGFLDTRSSSRRSTRRARSSGRGWTSRHGTPLMSGAEVCYQVRGGARFPSRRRGRAARRLALQQDSRRACRPSRNGA